MSQKKKQNMYIEKIAFCEFSFCVKTLGHMTKTNNDDLINFAKMTGEDTLCNRFPKK